MDSFLGAVRRLGLHQRICWQRPRQERTIVVEKIEDAVVLLEQLMHTAREIEVHRAGEQRVVIHVRD